MRAMFEDLSQRVHRWRRATVRGLVAVIAMIGPTAHAMQTTTYFHNDVSGTPQMETDAAGTVVWKESYQPYGSRLNNAPASADNKLWFTGKSYDANVGLSYMGARYYDPVIGRFAGVDPESTSPFDVHTFNRYAYGNNNPYKYVDPNGRAGILAIVVPPILAIGAWYYTRPADRQEQMRHDLARAGDWLKGLIHKDEKDSDQPVHDVVVPGDKYPESAEHIKDAQNNGQPEVLTIDRKGAKGRRAEAMKGQPTVPGKDRDECPPAMFGEGGDGASVRPISPSDNRGAGACIGAQCRDLPDGSRVRIVPGS